MSANDSNDEIGYYGDQANDSGPAHDRLKRFYTPQPIDVTKADYDAWASDYDKNTVSDSGYCAPQILADLVSKYVTDTQTTIVELGCGTGLLGRELMDKGYDNLIGLDLSPGMLSEARKTDAYMGLGEIDMTTALPLDKASCDVLVSVGVYGPGIVGPEHLSLLSAPSRPGGYSIHSFNGLSWRKRPFETALTQLIDEGDFELVEKTWAPYISGENIDGVYVVLRKR